MRVCTPMLAAAALPGCVAGALPVLAGGVVAKRTVDKMKPVPVAQVVRGTVPAESGLVSDPASGAVAQNLTEQWVAAALFAADLAGKGMSVLPDPAATEADAMVRPCADEAVAVLVDLDPGEAAFRPELARTAAPGVAAALSIARAKGLTVLWTSVLDESREADARIALVNAGLDPTGRDPILLTRDPAETKTERRRDTAGEWCIAAIIGDRKGDFDDLMNYLRDPEAPTPFDPLLGHGWFELPPPFLPPQPVADAA